MALINSDGWQKEPSSYTRRHTETKTREEQFAAPLDVCTRIQYGRI
jgi:hypothetical protein